MPVARHFLLALASGTVVLGGAGWASGQSVPETFEVAAPSATLLFVFKPVQLKFLSESTDECGDAFLIGARIDVLLNLRGDATSIERVIFSDSKCGGHNLQVGHYYLVATSSSGPDMYVRLADGTIGEIGSSEGPNTEFEGNEYVRRVREAMAGLRSYESVLDAQAHARAAVNVKVVQDRAPSGTAKAGD